MDVMPLLQLEEIKVNLRKYMDLENEARRSKESIEKELRETQIRLAGLEDIDVKQLKNTVKTLQRQVNIFESTRRLFRGDHSVSCFMRKMSFKMS